MRVIKTLYCIAILFIVTLDVAYADVIINTSKPLQSQFIKPNETYVISSPFDLKGASLRLPSNCVLKFKKGMLFNGVLIGDNTRIVASKVWIFKNLKIEGTWNSRKIYSEWIGLKEGSENDNKTELRNLMALCKGNVKKEVYIQTGCYWTSVNEYSCAFSIPSNTTMHCRATINELPNNFKYACLISVHKATNVTINGGEYVGDLKEHIDNKGEWSHGIEIRGSSNVIIKNVKCCYFWGDGIDVVEGFNAKMEPIYVCNNVAILQSECLYNRRQGLSIEAVNGCLIKGCNFSFTGQYRSTPPSAGIDIEAWAANAEKIKNVRIENCIMEGNIGASFQSYANAVWGNNYDSYQNSIIVNDCIMEDIAISHTNGIEFKRCIIDKIKYVKQSQSVKYTNCIINNGNDIPVNTKCHSDDRRKEESR